MIDMIEPIVRKSLFIMSTILGSWLILSPTLSTAWVGSNSHLSVPGDKHAAALVIGFH